MEPLKIINQVVENLNNIRSQKYGYPPEEIGQKTIMKIFVKFMIFIDF